MRQTIITCIPKGNKNRSLIKNWCPISLLPVVYKMASSVLAERLKPILKDIFSTHQSVFLSGRSISDCTRLIYDLMFYTRKHKIPGLLMQIDFQKAFDSVSRDFLYIVLEKFDFNDKFIKWIRLFNKDIKAYVIQCGFLSNPIPIERGCLIQKSSDIIGIKIGTNMYKLTHFADDTTILLDGTTKFLQATLNMLEIFGDMSGLIMNSEKTKLIWIGSKIVTKEKLNVSNNLYWGDSQFNLLGMIFSCNLHEMQDLNYGQALVKAKYTLKSWEFRC